VTHRTTPTSDAKKEEMRQENLKELILSLPENAELLRVIEQEDKTRFDHVRKTIAHRLKKACSHMDAHEFDALVDRITRVQLRGERPRD
jgi:hypothetical protein